MYRLEALWMRKMTLMKGARSEWVAGAVARFEVVVRHVVHDLSEE